MRDRLFDLRREYEALLRRIEKQYPRYFDLKYRFATASAEEVQQRILDERTALVEFFVGRDRLFVFVVTKRGLTSSSVAKDASFEKAAESGMAASRSTTSPVTSGARGACTRRSWPRSRETPRGRTSS